MDMCTATLHCLYLPVVAGAVGDAQQTAFVPGFTAVELLSWMLTAHRVDKGLVFRTANIPKKKKKNPPRTLHRSCGRRS